MGNGSESLSIIHVCLSAWLLVCYHSAVYQSHIQKHIFFNWNMEIEQLKVRIS